MEHASGLGFDEGAGGVAVVGMEQRRGLPQETEGVDQVEAVAGIERSRIQVSAAIPGFLAYLQDCCRIPLRSIRALPDLGPISGNSRPEAVPELGSIRDG